MNSNKLYSKDLSPKAINTAINKTAAQKPLVLYPMALSIVGLLYGAVFDFGLLSLIPIAAGMAISGGSYIWNRFVNGHKEANNYIRAYRVELEKKLELMLAALKIDLDKVGNKDAYKQVSLFQKKYAVFKEVLDKKLDTGELTYNRYLSIAEQVFLGGLDNIENAGLAIRSVSTIKAENIGKEIKELSDSGNDRIKKTELQNRLNLHQQQMTRASTLLLENETALTQLDHVTSKIANINTKQQRAEIDLEDAMAELRHLISKTETYSNDNQ